jgi:hypothetical protein
MAATTEMQPFRSGFCVQDIHTNGATLSVRAGGQGPAVVLLHGYGETGDMWAPLAAELARDHTVVAPDLRGMGLSARPDGGYDKKTQGQDIAGVLDVLGIERADLVTHDIGNMVGVRICRAVSSPRHSLRPHGRTTAGNRAVGGDSEEPAVVAFPLWRP